LIFDALIIIVVIVDQWLCLLLSLYRYWIWRSLEICWTLYKGELHVHVVSGIISYHSP